MATGPTTEIGRSRGVYRPPGSLSTALGWAAFMDTDEYVKELKWPQSVRSYDIMRTDSQLSALYRAMTMPIRRYKWLLNPNGANPTLVEQLAADIGLDIKGQDPLPRGRRRGRFSFNKHLSDSLLALIYGHMYFEQVGQIDNGMWRLRKLAARMPRTIGQINIDDDGSLISIKQNLPTGQGSLLSGGYGGIIGGPEIPVGHLVGYIWDQEGDSWVGRSLFRDCYKNWLLKDRLLRIDTINHEKAGGVAIAEAAPGATPRELAALSKMAQEFKVGEDSGGAVPAGTKFDLKRIGSASDVIASIRYHDESMARLFLMMFMQLGQTETGSRALGGTFVEYAYITQRAVAEWFCDIFSSHVIEDWVDWNYGEDVQAPLLTYVIEEPDEYLPVIDLCNLVNANLLTVDPELEDTLRERFHLSPRMEGFTQPVPVAAKAKWGTGVFSELRKRQLVNRYAREELRAT